MTDRPNQRYSLLGTHMWTDSDGVTVRYLARRILPRLPEGPAQATVEVRAAERPDLTAARALGDPLSVWRLLDVNPFLNPFDMTAQPGQRLRIPGPDDPR